MIRQQLPLWGLILGLWALLAVTFAGQLVFAGNLDWAQALTISIRDWYPWALLTPAVAWLAFKFPFEKDKLFLSIPLHVVACMIALLICEFLAPPLPVPQRPARPQNLPANSRDGAFPENQLRRGFDPEDRPPFRPELRPGLRPEGKKQPGFRPQNPEEEFNAPNRPFGAPPFRPNQVGPQGPQRPPFGPMAEPVQRPRQMVFVEGLIRRARFNVPVYWIVFSLVQAFVWFRRSQERERSALALQASLAEARLESLRMQLHPHFLFNTLNAISTLVHKDPVAADEMIVNLSELLRATLETREQQIPLNRELELLDRYLDIQQVRFAHRLQVIKEVQPEAIHALVPTLILQPLVENSIRHGVEPHTGEAVIRITAVRHDATLRLVVADNGAGAKAGETGKGEGIGLSNTRERLRELHGASASLAAGPGKDQGFQVELTLPFQETKPPSRTENEP